MLAPKKVKWRKMMKGRVRGAESRGLEMAFGDFGLKAIETARVDTRALEAARIALTRRIRTSPIRRNRPRPGWAKARGRPKDGSRS
jgi:large subunit ribosomal protein L16